MMRSSGMNALSYFRQSRSIQNIMEITVAKIMLNQLMTPSNQAIIKSNLKTRQAKAKESEYGLSGKFGLFFDRITPDFCPKFTQAGDLSREARALAKQARSEQVEEAAAADPDPQSHELQASCSRITKLTYLFLTC